MTKAMRAPILLSLGALLLVPASASAEFQTFGSDLSLPATQVQEHQADTAFWPAALHNGRNPLVPVAGQIKEVRIKGLALRRPDTRGDRSVGGETMFHVQALDGPRFRITSQDFFLPTGGDAQQVTTFAPANFCVQAGERIAFNTVGGFDGVGAQPESMGGAYSSLSPYPKGTPLQIFGSASDAGTNFYEQANGTDNGETMAPNGSGPREADQGPVASGSFAGQELLMQMTLATGDDRSYECGGPNTYRPADPVRTPTSGGGGAPPGVQITTIPARQTIRVSRRGDAGMALFCQPGAGRCRGRVTVFTKGARRKPIAIGSARYSIAPKSTGKLKVRLSKTGRRLFSRGKGKLSVSVVAVTAPGGAVRTRTFKTFLRKHRG